MRTILPAWLWVVLAVSTVGAVAAQKIDVDSVQVVTWNKLDSLLATYGPARDIRWHRKPNEPLTMVGSLDKGLKYAWSFDIFITITEKATIWFRVYPVIAGDYINLETCRDPQGLMRKMLRDNYRNFFWWATNDAWDVFAGFQFTLESGFPDEAFKVVIRSVPLIDESVGEMLPFIEE